MTAHLTIGFQLYTMEQEKRGLYPYDDKRYLLAGVPDGRPNPNIHAYGHRDLAAEEHLVADQPEPGAEVIIWHPDERFNRSQARVTRRFKLAGSMEMDRKLPDCDADGRLHVDEHLMAERLASARPGGPIRIGEVIKQIIARDNLERSVSPPAQMPAPPTPKRAGPSGLNAHLPQFRRRVDSSDKDETERPVWLVCRPHLKFDDGDYEQVETEPEPPRQTIMRDAAWIRLSTLRPTWMEKRATTNDPMMSMTT